MSLNIWCRGRNVIWSLETNFLFNLTSRQSRQLSQRKLILYYLTMSLLFATCDLSITKPVFLQDDIIYLVESIYVAE